MANHLDELLRYFALHDDGSPAALRIIASILPLKSDYAADPSTYELNKRIGLLLANEQSTMIFAAPFLINAVNANRDEPARRDVLSAMAKVFEAQGDLERENLVLQEAVNLAPALYRDLALSWQRLGKLDKASRAFNAIIAHLESVARSNAKSRGEEMAQIIWPDRVICTRYGELSRKVDLFIKARRLGLTSDTKVILPAPDDWVCNKALLAYWQDQHADSITILTDPEEIANAHARYESSEILADIFRLPNGRAFDHFLSYPAIWALWEEAGHGSLLSFREDHDQIGRQWLEARGVPDDAWFVGLHVRESGYHQDGGVNFNDLRNDRIFDYLPAVQAISEAGGWIVRIGDPSMTPMPAHPRVIDYAVETDRSPELDLFFCARALFMIAATSGPAEVANVFGTPVLGANVFPFGNSPNSRNDLYLHKLCQRRADGHLLDIAEMVAPPRRNMQTPQYFAKAGLEVIPNTADDLREATIEMLARQQGTFQCTPTDEAALERYRTMSEVDGIGIPARPAASFLRRHPHLIRG